MLISKPRIGSWLKSGPIDNLQFQAHTQKLAKRFYGPFKVVARIGSTAYKLQLPEGVKIHPIFHCFVLKKYHQPSSGDLPASQPVISPLTILGTRRTSDTADSKLQVLVQWQGLSPDDASWED